MAKKKHTQAHLTPRTKERSGAKPPLDKQKSVPANIYNSQKKFFETAYKTGQDVWTHGDDLLYLNDFLSVLTEHLNQDARVLDLGCGRGANSIRMAKRGFRVLGLDIVPQVLQYARKEARGAAVHRKVQFRTQDFLDWKAIPKHLFEGALDRGCFHHMREADWPRYVKNLRTLLKTRALFFLVTFSDKSPCFDRSKGHGQIHRGSLGTSHTHYDHFFTAPVLKKIFGPHFKILKIRHRQDNPYSFHYALMRAK